MAFLTRPISRAIPVCFHSMPSGFWLLWRSLTLRFDRSVREKYPKMECKCRGVFKKDCGGDIVLLSSCDADISGHMHFLKMWLSVSWSSADRQNPCLAWSWSWQEQPHLQCSSRTVRNQVMIKLHSINLFILKCQTVPYPHPPPVTRGLEWRHKDFYRD